MKQALLLPFCLLLTLGHPFYSSSGTIRAGAVTVPPEEPVFNDLKQVLKHRKQVKRLALSNRPAGK